MVNQDITQGRERRRNYLIRNQTPHELVLIGPPGRRNQPLVLRLSPLQRRLIGGHPAQLFKEAASFAQLDHAIDWDVEPSREARMLFAAWLTGLGFVVALAGLILWLSNGSIRYLIGGLALLLVLTFAVPLVTQFQSAENDKEDRAVASHQTEMDPTPVHGDWWELLRDLGISLVQGLVSVLLIVVAVGGPAVAIYYGTEVHTVIKLNDLTHWQLVGGVRHQYILVARSLRLVLLIVMSVLPALMFYQFDREKLVTLVDRWLHAVFRLDPSLQTVADVDAKYGRRVEEFFGASLAVGADVARRRLRNRTPVVAATLLIAIGWIVVLVNTSTGSSAGTSFQSLFVPEFSPLTMGFLGSYFLSIQVALRGYIRGDLKPKTYNLLTVRILMAVILAWALQALFGTNTTTLALSFMAGITPNTILLLVRDFAFRNGNRLAGRLAERRRRASQKRGTVPAAVEDKPADPDELASKSPLSLLEEIDVYERTRLEEEGITCVQALARHDLIDLMLSSRIPVPRLIDWLDQALLYQHIAPRVAALHKLGVRSATDFLQLRAFTLDEGKDQKPRDALSSALETALDVDPAILEAVLDDDEWMAYVRNWRGHDGSDAGPVTVYDDVGRRSMWQRKDGVSPSTHELLSSVIDLRDPPAATADVTRPRPARRPKAETADSVATAASVVR